MSRVLIERTVLVGLLISAGVIWMFMSSLTRGAALEEARTVAVTTMVFFQFFQAVNSRSETESIFRLNPLGNPMLAYGLIASVLAHFGSIYLAPLQWVFHTRPIGADLWIQIIAVSLTVILAVEADKWLRKKR
jgi:Ca2+-transporting ATPase